MSKLILDKPLPEHFGFNGDNSIPSDGLDNIQNIKFKNQEKCFCFSSIKVGNELKINTSFYIGVDWIIDGELAVLVEPKIDGSIYKTDYLGMLSYALKHPGIFEHASKIFEIKFDSKPIKIHQKDDYLTPLIIIQYTNVLKNLVRKGLKKSYYKVHRNINSKIKGKILISTNIKKNVVKNKFLDTYCQFEEFGIDNIENKILKKALEFSKRYMSTLELKMDDEKLNYISPAFMEVSSDVSLNDLKSNKSNLFYKDYDEGLKLARIILERFGYNINSIESNQKIHTPPFWIDMSLLFELYTFGLLKERFNHEVLFQFNAGYGYPDFLIPSLSAIVDTKYKPKYNKFEIGENPLSKVIDDIRQLSGYSRDRKVQEALKAEKNELIDCYIVYPNIETGAENLKEFDFINATKIDNFPGFYTIGIKIPMQNII